MGKQKKVEVRTVREVLQRDLEDPEFRVEWERTALARAVALAVLRYRNNHQLSQRDLAHKLDWKQPAVARLESGEVNPALETLLDRMEVQPADAPETSSALTPKQ